MNLVTGATGFVGSAVALHLLKRGEAVRVLVRPGSDLRNLQGLRVEIVQGDLRDPRSLDRAMDGSGHPTLGSSTKRMLRGRRTSWRRLGRPGSPGSSIPAPSGSLGSPGKEALGRKKPRSLFRT
jgi:hypothetical protein